MTFDTVSPPSKRPKDTGVCCYVRGSKNGPTFRLVFSRDAQQQIFGRSIVGERFIIGVGRNDDCGKLLISPNGAGFKAADAIKGGAAIKCDVWPEVPLDRHGKQWCRYLGKSGLGVLIGLPDWPMPNVSSVDPGAQCDDGHMVSARSNLEAAMRRK